MVFGKDLGLVEEVFGLGDDFSSISFERHPLGVRLPFFVLIFGEVEELKGDLWETEMDFSVRDFLGEDIWDLGPILAGGSDWIRKNRHFMIVFWGGRQSWGSPLS